MPTPRSIARRRQWPIRSHSAGAYGRWLRRFANYRWRRGAGLQQRHQPHLRRGGWCRLPVLAEHAGRFALAGGGTNFTIANALGTGRSDLFQAGAFVRHTVGPAYISAALAYGWQDITTDRTVTIAGVDQLRANSMPTHIPVVSKAVIAS